MTAFVLFTHPHRSEAHEVSASIAELALEAGLKPVVPLNLAEHFGEMKGVEFRKEGQLADGCDFTVAVGGDGTLLYAFRQVPGLPLVGVHAGELGYLTSLQPDDAGDLVRAAADGALRFDDMAVLGVLRGHRTDLALNDAVIAKGPDGRAPKLRLHIDGTEFVTMLADAVVLATPTGSTGYTFSARGPVVSRRLSAMIVTPVAPHTLWDRPLVLGPSSTVEVELVADRSAILMVDGNWSADLAPGDRVTVSVSETPARMVRWGDETPITRLRRLTEPAKDYDV